MKKLSKDLNEKSNYSSLIFYIIAIEVAGWNKVDQFMI